MKMTLNCKLHILNDEERMKLATFLQEELGIKQVMTIEGKGHDIRILSIESEEVSEDG